MRAAASQTVTTVHPDIIYIPLKNLSVVWVQTQRRYQEKWAKEIADNLDPDKFDPIVVTLPNGHGVYHIVEGQHRRHALEMYAAKVNPSKRGDTEQAPCRIVQCKDPARAAEIWLGINGGRKAIRPIDHFKVSVVAGREPEVTINQIVLNNDYKITATRENNSISAVGAMKTVFNRHGRVTLNLTLRTLRAIWNGDPSSVSANLLKGFGLFLHEFAGHVDSKRLVMKLSERWSPYKIERAADARKQSTQEKLDEAISELLMREYNRGIRETQRLKHKE